MNYENPELQKIQQRAIDIVHVRLDMVEMRRAHPQDNRIYIIIACGAYACNNNIAIGFNGSQRRRNGYGGELPGDDADNVMLAACVDHGGLRFPSTQEIAATRIKLPAGAGMGMVQ